MATREPAWRCTKKMPASNAVLDGINPQHCRPVIPLGKIDSMLKIREALQRGEYMSILADRSNFRQ